MSQPRFMLVGDISLRLVDEQPAGASAAGPIVFLHALGCDLHLWDNVAAHFTGRHRVVRYDLRGHGLSDSGPAECSIDDHANDLEGLLDQLGVTGATLAGVSVGGMIALAMAVRYPARVRRLVLCATGARIGTRELWFERIATVRAGGIEALADGVMGRWFTGDFSRREPATWRGWRNRLVRTSLAGYVATCAALRDADLRAEAARVRAPAIVLSGEHDVSTPPALGRELAAQVPRARFELIAGAAHLPPLEQPGPVTAAIARFLEEAA